MDVVARTTGPRRGPLFALALLLLAAGCEADRPAPAAAPAPTPGAAPAPASRAEAPAERPAKAASPPTKVLVVGTDGFDPVQVRRLVARGAMPNLQKLMQEGSSGTLFSEREIRSPALWTTLATGRPREVHGIYDFVTGSRLWPADRCDEPRRLVTSNMRAVPAIWNLASDAGLTVGVVGWLSTWPAEEVHGVMVSPYVALGQKKQHTIKGGLYADEDRQVYPEARWDEIKQYIVSPFSLKDSEVEKVVPRAPDDLAALYPRLRRYREAARWSIAHTRTMRNTVLGLLETEQPDLTMVFVEGADSLGHRFWLFSQPNEQIEAQLADAGLPTGHAGRLSELYGEVIDRYYTIVDDMLRELLDQVDDDTLIMVISDHGFGSRTGQWELNTQVPFEGEHRIEGFIALRGPGVKAGAKIHGATLYDIVPTIIDALGMEDLEDGEGVSVLPSLEVAEESEPRAAAGPAELEPLDSSFDAEEVERLRSLGYVQ
ncbi:MAG: alkaline phosphatase family protein [Deltaproteobacteria bacterium]|nr:alkaline phosphatase family protein [Deltaproteobacteria bacterium]